MSLLFLWQFIWKGLHNICLFWRWRSHAVSKSKSLFFSNKPLIAFSSLSFISFFFSFFLLDFLDAQQKLLVIMLSFQTIERSTAKSQGTAVSRYLKQSNLMLTSSELRSSRTIDLMEPGLKHFINFALNQVLLSFLIFLLFL